MMGWLVMAVIELTLLLQKGTGPFIEREGCRTVK